MSDREQDRDSAGGFRVVDRRRFDAEGQERETTESVVGKSESAEPAAERPLPAFTAAAAPVPQQPAAPVPESPSTARAVPQGEPFEGESPVEAPSLGQLILSLYTQTMLALGEVPTPGGQPATVDVDSARYTIDLLGVLQLKTRGNLDPEEHQLLENALYDLRVRFVAHRHGE